MSRRKNKQTRKYKPRNEFRYNKSYTSGGHPQYIFGETQSGKLKSFGLTHSPDDSFEHYPLKKNPNPKDTEQAHIQAHVHTGNPEYYSKTLDGWAFDKEDMPIVRHLKKKYKKSTNRRPKKKSPKK